MADQLNKQELMDMVLRLMKQETGVAYWWDSNGTKKYPYLLKRRNPEHTPGPKGKPMILDGPGTDSNNMNKVLRQFVSIEDGAKALVHALLYTEGNVRIVDKAVEEEINRRVQDAIEQTRSQMSGMFREQIEQMRKEMSGVKGSNAPPPPPVPQSLRTQTVADLPILPPVHDDVVEPLGDDQPKSLEPSECPDVVDWCNEQGKRIPYNKAGRINIGFVLMIRKQRQLLSGGGSAP